jgi:hypothetical protein
MEKQLVEDTLIPEFKSEKEEQEFWDSSLFGLGHYARKKMRG